MKFAFIGEHAVEFSVKAMCRVLGVSRSGFYRRQRTPVGKRESWRSAMTEAVREAHMLSRGAYGSPRVHRALQASGRRLCRNSVAKLMRAAGLQSKCHKRFRVRTTDSNHAHPIASNVLDRRFDVERLNQVWLADITYIPTDEGFLYLAGVMDLCSRRVIGWSMADHMRTELPLSALRMAITRRGVDAPGSGGAGEGLRGLLHHSDRGTQYACGEYQRVLAEHGITASMSRTGNCYDNAPQERLWAALKTELTHHQRFASRASARLAIFDYIEVFYNRERLHSAIGYISPERFEATITR